MELSRAQASEILRQIEQNQWSWLKVKRFVPDAYATAEERYTALEKHHEAETGRMIEVIKALCHGWSG